MSKPALLLRKRTWKSVYSFSSSWFFSLCELDVTADTSVGRSGLPDACNPLHNSFRLRTAENKNCNCQCCQHQFGMHRRPGRRSRLLKKALSGIRLTSEDCTAPSVDLPEPDGPSMAMISGRVISVKTGRGYHHVRGMKIANSNRLGMRARDFSTVIS